MLFEEERAPTGFLGPGGRFIFEYEPESRKGLCELGATLGQNGLSRLLFETSEFLLHITIGNPRMRLIGLPHRFGENDLRNLVHRWRELLG